MYVLALAAAVVAFGGVTNSARPRATLLGPGVVSTSAYEGPFALTPDGRTIYFTRFEGGMESPKFFVSHLSDGKWSESREAKMPEGIAAAPLCFSADGKRLFYTHERDASGWARVWVADKDGEGWKDSRPLGGAFERWEGDQISPAVTADGTLYFTSSRGVPRGASDIYRSRLKYGQYQEPEALGRDVYREISTALDESTVAVAAASGVMVFSSTGAPNGLGGSDLYLADVRDPVPQWDVHAYNLGPAVNSAADEMDPSLSPDGKRLYFCRDGDIYEIDLERLRQYSQSWSGWARRADMATPRVYPQVAAAQGLIYVYGGRHAGRWVDSLEAYDPAADSWSELGPGPSGWKWAMLVSKDDRLYLFRGDGAGLAEYRPKSRAWQIRTQEQVLKTGRVIVIAGEKAYSMEPLEEAVHRRFTSFLEFDFRTNRWTPRASMPFLAFRMTALNGRVYAMCGGGAEGNRIAEYDPALDGWKELARMQVPRWSSAVAPFGNEIWLIGGHSYRSIAEFNYDLNPSVVRFDPGRNRWSDGPDLPSNRFQAAAVTVNGRLFVLGGIELGGMQTGGMWLESRSLLEYVPEPSAR